MRSSSTGSTSLMDQEYSALRTTIAQRGTVRLILAPATIFVWAGLCVLQLTAAPVPLATMFTLAVLTAGFEAINALHVGVERIGRYLQVFYEETAADNTVSPLWETTAMAASPALPGGGVDPLFTLLFLTGVTVNGVLGFSQERSTTLSILMIILHVAVAIRMVRAQLAASKQRARDLEHYRRVRDAIPRR